MAFQNSDKPDHPIIFTQMQQSPIQLLAYFLLYLLILAIRMQTSKRCEISFPSFVRQNDKTSLDFAQKSNQPVIIVIATIRPNTWRLT
ncbi:MAG: hypothetical protein CMI25_05485 [Opitutae bacterium]|nr:hypothetical protein [Opitutae bacterium]